MSNAADRSSSVRAAAVQSFEDVASDPEYCSLGRMIGAVCRLQFRQQFPLDEMAEKLSSDQPFKNLHKTARFEMDRYVYLW